MKEPLISFETAKLAKEKGFKLQSTPFGYVTKFYRPSTGTLLSYGRTGRSKLNTLIYAPTQSLLQKWLREIYQIDITVITNWSFSIRTYRVGLSYILNNKVEIWFSKKEDKVSFIEYNTYEEALEVGLYQALKLV